jgi:hypothetical protein
MFLLIQGSMTFVTEVKTESISNDEQDKLSTSLVSTQIKDIKNSNLPPYWNWKDLNGVDWTTPAKNQGRCPSCVFFCMVGALESIIKIREKCPDFNPDLSEQYIMSCVFMKNPRSTFFENVNGTIFESCFPYKARFFIPCSWKSSNWKKYFVPSSKYYFTSGATIEFIKNKLIEHGPIVLSIYAPGWSRFSNGILGMWGRNHHNPDDYFSKDVPKFRLSRLNHLILLVGWKDNTSMENGGYWICKNSWGVSWGYDGFFNLEYGGLNSDLGYVGWIDYNPNDFNWPPIGRPILNGPIYMDAGVEYEFNFSSIDPEGDVIYYKFSWGDNTESEWFGPFESGGIITIKHSWNKKGNYKVKVKAKNENGIESDWMPEEIINQIRLLYFKMTK